MASFYGWGSTASRLEPLRGGSLLFTTKFPEISGNVCIIIVCYPICEAMNFEIYLSFLIKSFSYMIRNSEQKLKYLINEESF